MLLIVFAKDLFGLKTTRLPLSRQNCSTAKIFSQTASHTRHLSTVSIFGRLDEHGSSSDDNVFIRIWCVALTRAASHMYRLI